MYNKSHENNVEIRVIGNTNRLYLSILDESLDKLRIKGLKVMN
jgi:hypothetical protein